MQRWQQIAIGLLCAALGVGSGVWALADRARGQWPIASATVLSHQQRLITHGSAVFVSGSFTVDGASHTFVKPWGTSSWSDGRWVPPSDLPAVGATVAVRYNPSHPDEVEIGPAPPLFNRLFPALCAVLFLVVSAAMLFTPPQSGGGHARASQKNR